MRARPHAAFASLVESGTAPASVAPGWLSWLVWGVAACFYLAGFYLRVSPAVMTAELMRAFAINAGALGNFSAVYFYTYVLMQIPIGVLVDSWGARRLLILGSVFAAAGTFTFGSTSRYALACLGRALVGAATAVGWVVTLKLTTHWMPARRFATVVGLSLFMGNVGALVAQVPLRLLVERVGWRAAILLSGAAILAIGAAAWRVVRNDPSERGYSSYAPAALQRQAPLRLADLVTGFRRIFTYRNTWLIFGAQGGFVGSILAFTGLWGAPFLHARFGLPARSAAFVCSVMILCWAVASPIFGAGSDSLRRRKPLYLGGAVVAAIGWMVMFYLPLPLSAFVIAAAVTSSACGAVVLGFPYAKESVPVGLLGTITGAINVGNMIGPTLLQPAIGWVLDQRWTGTVANGLRTYEIAAFRTAFLLIVAWSVLGCVLIALTRETNCVQTA